MKFKDGFEVEEYRKQLLSENKIKQLISTYSDNFPSISDKNSGAFWDKRFEEDYSNHHMEHDRLKIVISFIKKNDILLDLGVGRGRIETLIHSRYGNSIQVYATDITSKTLRQLQKKFPFWNFSTQELSKLKFKSDSFDKVLLLEVLEHIKPKETLIVLKEIHRVLKKQGFFIVSIPINEGLEDMYPLNPNSHLRVYSEELIRFELEYSGFIVERVIKLTAFPNYYLLKKMVNMFFNLRRPNNLIFICRKK